MAKAHMKDELKTKKQLMEELVEVRAKMHDLESSKTKCQETEKALRQSEDMYQTFFENTGTATIIIEEDTTISMSNVEFGNFTGFEREQILGRSWKEFVVMEDINRLFGYHKKRRIPSSVAPRNYEFRIQNRQGHKRNMFMTIAMIPGTKKSIASMLDITKRISAEKALKQSEKRFRLLVETMNDGLGVLDTFGKFTYVNKKLCSLLGYPPREILGKYGAKFIVSRDQPSWEYRVSNRYKDDQETYELTWKHKNGQQIDTIVSPRAIYDDHANFIGGFGIITDITERKTMEKEILGISERERRKIGYDLHDDLGQHLIGIDMMITVLKNTLKAKAAKETMDADKIHALVKEAITKTRQLSRGLCPVHLVSQGLESALKEMSSSTGDIFRISCTFNCPHPVPIHDNALAMHLYHIAQESIHNAITHGKATIIKIDLLKDNTHVTLKITDNGIGIPSKRGFSGMGLRIMQYRSRMIGASLKIDPGHTGGTIVTCLFNSRQDP
ncbi:MAG: PAS domain S-box protein [Thermodesulfobacteriota bacterium]|nr:PAS domain S-box protein [Thermodesulfobacteriota bacterium]